MSTLPDILQTAVAGSSNGGGERTLPGTPEKGGEPFDHLMTRAMSPTSGKTETAFQQSLPVKNETDGSAPQAKTVQTIAPDSGKVRAKKTTGNSDGGANPSATLEVNFAAINSENILIQTVPPVAAMTDIKSELAADAPVTVNQAGIATDLPVGKNASPALTNVSIAAVSKNQPSVEVNSIVKNDSQGKISKVVESLAGQKMDSADSKVTGPDAQSPQISPMAREASGDSAAAEPAVETISPTAQDQFSKSPFFSAKTPADAQADVNGTPAAPQDVPMKNNVKTERSEGLAGKILPAAAVSTARENNLPTIASSSATATVAANSGTPGQTIDVVLPSGDLAANAASADFRARTLERTQDLVVLHSKSLSGAGNDLLQVVIKPGAGTQLSLELRQRGDGVEAQATLQRGDFEHLNQHWPALQQQLEQRGIRLAPLASDGNSDVGDGSQAFQNRQNNFAEPESFPAGAFAEVAPAGLHAQVSAGAETHRGWESWA
jgi:hypothetical protein